MLTIRDLGEHSIVLRSFGRASTRPTQPGAWSPERWRRWLLELGRERRARPRPHARRAISLSVAPRVLSADKIALAERIRASGEPVPVIAETLGVSRATLYRTLAEKG